VNGHKAGTVEVVGELSVFDERAIGNHLLELLLSNEVVMLSVNLARAW
jgi:hypothetical protein